jgi:hypothetical protein
MFIEKQVPEKAVSCNIVHQLLVGAEKTKPKPPMFESQSETKQLTRR